MTRCEVEVHVWATEKRRDDEGVTGFGREQQELFVRSPCDSVTHYYLRAVKTATGKRTGEQAERVTDTATVLMIAQHSSTSTNRPVLRRLQRGGRRLQTRVGELYALLGQQRSTTKLSTDGHENCRYSSSSTIHDHQGAVRLNLFMISLLSMGHTSGHKPKTSGRVRAPVTSFSD